MVHRELPGINRISENFSSEIFEVNVALEFRDTIAGIIRDFSGMINGNNVGVINNVMSFAEICLTPLLNILFVKYVLSKRPEPPNHYKDSLI